MAIIRAFSGALGGTFADLWKDIITAGSFDEYTVVAPGVPRSTNNGRGSNDSGSDGVITNGSRIYVPENTAAFIFDQSGIENVIVEPGGYVYSNGERSLLAGDGFGSLLDSVAERFTFGGQPARTKYVAFVNLREIRGVKFGTPAPLVYHDRFYDADLEIRARGSMALKVTDPVRFVRNFVPAGEVSYSFYSDGARRQILSEFVQSFIVAVNSLSDEYRISQLPGQANAIAERVRGDAANAGTWPSRFGFEVTAVGIEGIEFTDDSRELVRRFSSNRMDVSAYEGISAQAGGMAAQQRIARGVEEHGFGDGGGMLFGMNFARSVDPMTAAVPAAVPAAAPVQPAQPVQTVPQEQPAQAARPEQTQPSRPAPQPAQPAMSFDEQLDALRKLKELLDSGILSQDEFDAKKRAILGL